MSNIGITWKTSAPYILILLGVTLKVGSKKTDLRLYYHIYIWENNKTTLEYKWYGIVRSGPKVLKINTGLFWQNFLLIAWSSNNI